MATPASAARRWEETTRPVVDSVGGSVAARVGSPTHTESSAAPTKRPYHPLNRMSGALVVRWRRGYGRSHHDAGALGHRRPLINHDFPCTRNCQMSSPTGPDRQDTERADSEPGSAKRGGTEAAIKHH